MTRRDFQELAAILAANRLNEMRLYRRKSAPATYTTAAMIADYCHIRNARFDRAKFMRAAGFL